MLVTGEQFNIVCAHCIWLIAIAKNTDSFLKPGGWPSWNAESVFVDCFQGNCPTGLLSQDGDEFTWQVMSGIHKPFGQWWQEIVKAYDKIVRENPRKLPARQR